MWDLLPGPGSESGLLHWEHGLLAAGPPGKPPDYFLLQKYQCHGQGGHVLGAKFPTYLLVLQVQHPSQADNLIAF